MSLVRLYADAALGGILSNPVLPTRNLPRQTPVEQSERATGGEDAARVNLSSAAREFAAAELARRAAIGEAAPGSESSRASGADKSSEAEAEQSEQSEQTTGREFSEEEQRQIAELKARDREVRAHEQAHLSALGGYSKGGAQYQYATGPDGKQYAVGGEVAVDVSPAQTPEETVRKAETIRRAANAPAEPSGADRAVAAQATQLAAQARAELQRERAEESGAIEGAPDAEARLSEESRQTDGVEASDTERPQRVSTEEPSARNRAALQASLSYTRSYDIGSRVSIAA